MSKEISSFNELNYCKNQKLLVLCDIDNTILYFPNCDQDCKEIIKEICDINDPDYEKVLKELKEKYMCIKSPNHTDYKGFVSLVDGLIEKGGKLIFITARGISANQYTRKHMFSIGINPDDFEIHYVGKKIPKGIYIKNNIDKEGYDNIIFIDDNEQYIRSVIDFNPEIECYKFIVR